MSKKPKKSDFRERLAHVEALLLIARVIITRSYGPADTEELKSKLLPQIKQYCETHELV